MQPRQQTLHDQLLLPYGQKQLFQLLSVPRCVRRATSPLRGTSAARQLIASITVEVQCWVLWKGVLGTAEYQLSSGLTRPASKEAVTRLQLPLAGPRHDTLAGCVFVRCPPWKGGQRQVTHPGLGCVALSMKHVCWEHVGLCSVTTKEIKIYEISINKQFRLVIWIWSFKAHSIPSWRPDSDQWINVCFMISSVSDGGKRGREMKGQPCTLLGSWEKKSERNIRQRCVLPLFGAGVMRRKPGINRKLFSS